MGISYEGCEQMSATEPYKKHCDETILERHSMHQGLPRLNPVTIKNSRDEPAILFNLPRKPAYPSGTTISDPLVYNSNESEPDPLEQPG